MNLGPAPVKFDAVPGVKMTQEWLSHLADQGDALAGEWRSGSTKIGADRDIDAYISVTGSHVAISFTWMPYHPTQITIPWNVVHSNLIARDAGRAQADAWAKDTYINITPGSGAHTITGILIPKRN